MKNNHTLIFLITIAVVALANIFVFLSIGTIISTALLVALFVVLLVYISDADLTKDKTFKDMIDYSKDIEEYKKYLGAVPCGLLIVNNDKTVVFKNDNLPKEIAEDFKKDAPTFEHFTTKLDAFIKSEDDFRVIDFTLGERAYSLQFKRFKRDDKEKILILFADKTQKSSRDIKKVYGKFWNFLKIGPISVLNSYLEGLRERVSEISQDIFLNEVARKQLDEMMRILDRSHDDIENLSIMVNTPESKLEKVDIVNFFSKCCTDLSADKDFIKIKLFDNLKDSAVIELDKVHTSKIIKNIADNVNEYTKSKKLDVEFNYTFEVGTNNKVVEVRFISADANINSNILKGLGKGIKTSKKGKHLGLGLEIVKKLMIAQGGDVDFRNASNGFTIAITYKV